MKKIIDEFTNLNISKQEKYQLRKAAEGLCISCGLPAKTKVHCLECAIRTRESTRRRREKQTGKIAKRSNALVARIEKEQKWTIKK